MDILLQDLRLAVRSLARARLFTVIAALCIGLGIAANVFVWSPFNALTMRPLPYRDAGRVMHLSTHQSRGPRSTFGSWSYPDYVDLAREVRTGASAFSGLGAFAQRQWNVGGMEEPERLQGARVTASLFPMLGLRPSLGRFFGSEEDDGHKVMVLGHGLWRRKFGGDPTIVGRGLTVNGEPYTVIGVMQEGMRFPESEDIWLPLEPGATREQRGLRPYQVLARLAPRIAPGVADQQLAAFMDRLAERYPESNRGWSAWLQPYQEDIAGEVRPIFQIMIGAVAFVLLITCANVANLVLARGSSRQRDVAVRIAVGASRTRIVRQLVTESLVLAAIGGVLGIALGAWGVEAFVAYQVPSDISFWMRFDVDRTVVAVSVALTALTGVIFGLAPALQLSRPALGEALKESGGRGSTVNTRIGRTRASLVVVQLALSLVLLAGASLMMRSFLATVTANLGFDSRGVLTADLALVGPRYAGDTASRAFLAVLEERVGAIPGVERVGVVGNAPVKSCCSRMAYYPEGKQYPVDEGPRTMLNMATPSLFAALGMPLLAGRAFSEHDITGAPRVAIVSESFARAEWPGVSAVGRRFRQAPNDTSWVTIVGVVPDIVQREVRDGRPALVYYPMAQSDWRNLSLIVRTTGDPSRLVAPLRNAVRTLDRDMPLAKMQTMEQVIRDRMFEPRVYGSMFAIFAIVALVLASIGLYGVMAFVVAQRTHEVGVRMALGARSADVLALVLGGAARLVAIGVLIGLPASLVMSQVLRGSLYGVGTTDPLTFTLVPVLLVVVTFAASYVPARRAASVDPIVALRSE